MGVHQASGCLHGQVRTHAVPHCTQRRQLQSQPTAALSFAVSAQWAAFCRVRLSGDTALESRASLNCGLVATPMAFSSSSSEEDTPEALLPDRPRSGVLWVPPAPVKEAAPVARKPRKPKKPAPPPTVEKPAPRAKGKGKVKGKGRRKGAAATKKPNRPSETPAKKASVAVLSTPTTLSAEAAPFVPASKLPAVVARAVAIVHPVVLAPVVPPPPPARRPLKLVVVADGAPVSFAPPPPVASAAKSFSPPLPAALPIVDANTGLPRPISAAPSSQSE